MSRKKNRKSGAVRRKASPTRVKQTAQAKAVDFATEYHYVINDLRRFGILAVAMFALLIVLAVVLG